MLVRIITISLEYSPSKLQIYNIKTHTSIQETLISTVQSHSWEVQN